MDAAWDCATGNGQVAKDLSKHFKHVFATDHSSNQIANAVLQENITYSVASAENSGFPDNKFDLVTVGQALHWFDIPKFFDEVKRVSKPNGVIAIWGYGVLKIDKDIDPIIDDFYNNIIGPYWDSERTLIEEEYKSISFPFERIDVPSFEFSFEWTLDQLANYLSTWSSVQKYLKQHGTNPVGQLISRIAPLWTVDKKKVSFPLFMLTGKVIK